MVDWLCIKIAGRVDKKFAVKAEAKLVVLEIVVVDEFDVVNESDEIDKHKRIALP